MTRWPSSVAGRARSWAGAGAAKASAAAKAARQARRMAILRWARLELEVQPGAKIIHQGREVAEVSFDDAAQAQAEHHVVVDRRHRHEALALEVVDQRVVGRVAVRHPHQ